MSEINFDIEGVLADAKAAAGLDDFGADDYLPGLKVLLQTYDQTGWSERGRKSKRKRVVKLLAARLRIEAAFKKYPEIKQQEIKQPIYLTGLPRTGTSALLNLLANDGNNRPLKLWEGMNPDPCEDFEHGKDDPRYVQMKAWEEHQAKTNPDFKKIHATSADTPEECIHLLNHTFGDVQYGIEMMMQPYGSWLLEQDWGASYDYYADLLRMVQWQRPGNRWLLKAPSHLWAMNHIVRNFPDACIVITHRNPLKVTASYCSMMAAMMQERELDKAQFGQVVLNYLVKCMQSAMQQREAMDANRFIDIQFNDFINDSMGVARSIYQHFGLELSSETEAAMQAHVDAHPMNKHGKHDYALEQYGLTEQQVLDAFDFYVKAYNVAV